MIFPAAMYEYAMKLMQAHRDFEPGKRLGACDALIQAYNKLVVSPNPSLGTVILPHHVLERIFSPDVGEDLSLFWFSTEDGKAGQRISNKQTKNRRLLAIAFMWAMDEAGDL